MDNSDSDWKVRRYLHDWCDYSKSLDVATAYFEIGSLLALDGEWQKVDAIRILLTVDHLLFLHVESDDRKFSDAWLAENAAKNGYQGTGVDRLERG